MTMFEEKVKVLAQFALDHYELGGHWIYECWDVEEYGELLDEVGGNMETAKFYLRQYWEDINEQEAETRWE